MGTEYLDYWGFKKPPFSLTPDPEMLYLSSQHSECLMRLKYAIFFQKGGALLVSDNAGNGKTSVLARLRRDLDDYYGGRVRVVFIDHPTLTPIEMIGEIAHQLGAELQTTEKIRALNHLRDRLFTLYNENTKVVVIVDEGQMLKERPDILGELRILLNFCVSDAFLLTFVFSGQKPLDSVLRAMPEFWQRLPVRFFLRNLDYNDTRAMIRYRLDKAGASEDIFAEEAFEGIYRYSEGCPRIACSVADLCLVIGYAKGAKRIGFAEVSNACRDMDSSGDGFHYYAFVKAQQLNELEQQDSPKPSQPKPESTVQYEAAASPEKPSAAPPRELPAVSVVACPSCAEANPKGSLFCGACDSPLHRKCPSCLMLVDSVSDDCPVCRSNMVEESRRLFLRVRSDLVSYDILRGGYDIWLKVNGITLADGEQILVILPQGSLFSSGPVFKMLDTGGSTKGQPGSLIVTDQRIIILNGQETLTSELARLDTFMVSSTGRFFGGKVKLIVGFGGRIIHVQLPFGAKKIRTFHERLNAYVRSVMLK